MTSPFNPKFYYRFFNNEFTGNSINAGMTPAFNTTVNMTAEGVSYSSENWQIFSQSDVYFIRNYDTGPDLQLGLTDDSPVVPRLLNTSGDLGQQWMLEQWSDGTWRITNLLMGNATALGIAGAGATIPAMDSSEGDEHWNVSINVSAGEITDSKMLSNVTHVQVSQQTLLSFEHSANYPRSRRLPQHPLPLPQRRNPQRLPHHRQNHQESPEVPSRVS